MKKLQEIYIWFGRKLIDFLTEEKISINHLIVAAFVYSEITNGDYLTAAITYLFGVMYCILMNKLSNA